MDGFERCSRNSFPQQVFKDQSNLAAAADHANVPSLRFGEVIQCFFVMVVPSRHDDAHRVGINVQAAERAINRTDDQAVGSRKAIRVTVLFPVVDNPDVEVDIGGVVGDFLSDMSGADNQQPTPFELWQVRDAVVDVRARSIKNRS